MKERVAQKFLVAFHVSAEEWEISVYDTREEAEQAYRKVNVDMPGFPLQDTDEKYLTEVVEFHGRRT
jgi:hypothetical protein